MAIIPPVLAVLFALAAGGDEGLDDIDIARRLREGDRDAFRVFFDRYHGLLFGYLRRRGIGPAVCEDLVQQAFVTIWERRAEIDSRKSLRSFLFTIGHNRALNHFRDTKKLAGDEELAQAADAANPEARTEYVLMLGTLQKVIEGLPERRRAVFELCFVEELTYREAADVLGISIKTVEHQMGAALKTLRTAFERYVES